MVPKCEETACTGLGGPVRGLFRSFAVTEPTKDDKLRNWKLMRKSVFGDLDGLLEHVDCKFTLVNVVMKRAKQLNNGASALTGYANPDKPVSTAFNEVALGKIRYVRLREGIK
jgi:DNA-directed RNA polymerase subunit omega